MNIKGFFGAMNLARWIMLVGGLAVVGLAYNGWKLHQERSALDLALAPGGDVERISGKIQLLGKQISKLQSDADREGLSGQDDPSLYFRGFASDPNVRLGQVEIAGPKVQTIIKGTEDLQYTIRPQSDSGAPRDRIVNYMYLLESKSRRVRVTALQLTPAQKLKEWEHSNDMWKWSIELTSRAKVEAKPDAK
jgi:hypothetical protein